MSDDAELCLHVDQRRDGPGSRADQRSRTWMSGHQGHENQPAGRQADIEPAPLPKRRAKRTGEEDAIVEQHDHRRDDHDLLAAHAQDGRDGRRGIPSPGIRGIGAPNDRIKGQKEEQAHHELGPLDDIRDALRLQGMNEPEDRHGRRQPCRVRSIRAREPRARQGSADDPEQGQAGQDVQGEVHGVITPDIEATQGIVDCQREIDDRPAPDGGALTRRRESVPDRPEVPNRRVGPDGQPVIEDERTVQAVVEGEHSSAGEDDGRDQRGADSGGVDDVPLRSLRLHPLYSSRGPTSAPLLPSSSCSLRHGCLPCTEGPGWYQIGNRGDTTSQP